MSTTHPVGPGAETDPSSVGLQFEASLERLFDQVYSNGDLAAAGTVMAPGARLSCGGTGQTYRGISGVKAHASRLRLTFAGLTVSVEAVRRTATGFEADLTVVGRFERPFGGVEPACVIGDAGTEPHGPEVHLSGTVVGSMTGRRLDRCALSWDLAPLDITTVE